MSKKRGYEEDPCDYIVHKIAKVCRDTCEDVSLRISEHVKDRGLISSDHELVRTEHDVLQNLEFTETAAPSEKFQNAARADFIRGVKATLKLLKDVNIIDAIIQKHSKETYKLILEDRRVHSRRTDVELDRISAMVPYSSSLSMSHWID